MEKKTLHIISHTHWDREWYMPFESHRYKLVQFFDKLLDTLDNDPSFRSFHLDGQGRITRFVRTFRDYGGAIDKVFQFATQSFGSYARLKDIRRVRIATRSDTDTVIQIQYRTDHGQRWDLTPIESRTWRLTPRNLAFRFLGVQRFAHVALRKPACRHVHHFALRLENNEPGCDMSVVSAEITAAFVGRMR